MHWSNWNGRETAARGYNHHYHYHHHHHKIIKVAIGMEERAAPPSIRQLVHSHQKLCYASLLIAFMLKYIALLCYIVSSIYATIHWWAALRVAYLLKLVVMQHCGGTLQYCFAILHCYAMPVQASRKPRITIRPLHQDFKPDTPHP